MSAQPFAVATLRLVLIVAGSWIAKSLSASALPTFVAVAVGIASFGVGMVIVTRMKLQRLAGR